MIPNPALSGHLNAKTQSSDTEGSEASSRKGAKACLLSSFDRQDAKGSGETKCCSLRPWRS